MNEQALGESAQIERDRAYMRRLGEYIDEANKAALEEHLALPIEERLMRSFRLAERSRGYVTADYTDDEDDPAQFYARARALGIIPTRSPAPRSG